MDLNNWERDEPQPELQMEEWEKWQEKFTCQKDFIFNLTLGY